mmetsp:Transcript_40883/g.112406  ORF Transcript_40883/g.112406 Transcript_40883/m.112406 type:complete len:451 (-) Transcript_40883:285-1637(-)
MSTYDLVTELHWDGISAVGASPTPLAAHGGRYTLDVSGGTHTMSAPLTIYYYTILTIHGNLDCAGNDVNLGSFGELHVDGSILNAGNISTGIFTNVTAGSVIGGSWALGGGGGCGIGRVQRAPCLDGKSVVAVGGSFMPQHVSTLSKQPPAGYSEGFGFINHYLSAGAILGGGAIDYGGVGAIEVTIDVRQTSSFGSLVLVKGSSFSFGGNLSVQLNPEPYSWWHLSVNGSLNFGDSLMLDSCFDCISAHSLRGSSLVLGAEYRAASLNVPGDVTVYGALTLSTVSALSASRVDAADITLGVASRLRASTLTSRGSVYLQPSADLSVSAAARVNVLQVASWGRVSRNITARVLQLAPHFYCADSPAGDGDLTRNFSSDIICHWPPRHIRGNPWGTHNPESSCRISTTTCDFTEGTAVPWLVKFAAPSGCFLGPDGTNVFGESYNFTQPCK